MKIRIFLILVWLVLLDVAAVEGQRNSMEDSPWLLKKGGEGFEAPVGGYRGRRVCSEHEFLEPGERDPVWDHKFGKVPLAGANVEVGIGSRFTVRAEGDMPLRLPGRALLRRSLGEGRSEGGGDGPG